MLTLNIALYWERVKIFGVTHNIFGVSIENVKPKAIIKAPSRGSKLKNMSSTING